MKTERAAFDASRWGSFADLPDIKGLDKFLVERPPIYVDRSMFPDGDDSSRAAADRDRSKARNEDAE
jgi:hypothetical protein